MTSIRAVVHGVGAMGSLATRMCLDRGIEVVGATARSTAKVGQDLGTLVGISPLGVTVQSDVARVLRDTRPDIALVTASSELEVMGPQFRVCIEHGVNVLTLEEESLFPWVSAPTIATGLDDLAKLHGVTIAATGVQDVFWNTMASTLMASAQQVDAVRGRSTWNSDDYGAAVQSHLMLGEDPSTLDSGALDDWDTLTVRNSLLALARGHGLTVIDSTESVSPIIAERMVTSPVTGQIVPAGRLLGISEHVCLLTREGVTLELTMRGYLHGKGETPVNEWRIEGAPTIGVRTDPFDGRFVTCTALVSRIPDVLAARPGFLSIDQLAPCRYRHGRLVRLE